MRDITELLKEKPLYSCCINLECENDEIFINNTFGQPICPTCGWGMQGHPEIKILEAYHLNRKEIREKRNKEL